MSEKSPITAWVSIAITATVLILGLAASWSQAQSNLEYYADRVSKLEETSDELDSAVDEIRIKQHGNEQILLTIKQSLEEIKSEIRHIKENMK